MRAATKSGATYRSLIQEPRLGLDGTPTSGTRSGGRLSGLLWLCLSSRTFLTFTNLQHHASLRSCPRQHSSTGATNCKSAFRATAHQPQAIPMLFALHHDAVNDGV